MLKANISKPRHSICFLCCPPAGLRLAGRDRRETGCAPGPDGGAPALAHILPKARVPTIPYRVDGHGDPEGRDFRVELGREAGVRFRRWQCERSRAHDSQQADFIDLMVSCGVCTEDVGTIVFGSLEHDSRRLCSVRKRTKIEPLKGWGNEPDREGHCVHGWPWTETLATPKRPQWMKQQPLQEELQ